MQRCSNKAYAMCPTRHLCGSIEEATFTEDSECAAFNRAVEDKPMTNADRIRAMSDENMAKLISDRSVESLCDIVCGGECKAIHNFYKSAHTMCMEIVLKYLQQPAEGE